MRQLIDRIEEFWCVHMHDALLWPIHGRYQCGVCQRQFPVPYAVDGHTVTHAARNVRREHHAVARRPLVAQ